MRNLATLVCLGLGGWALVSHVPFAPLAAIVLALLGLSAVLNRPKSGLRRSYDQHPFERRARR